MPITEAQIQAAGTAQQAAAHDPNRHVRLIAGPGSGKSYAIEERVRWLLEQGVGPEHIRVVSFTRASSVDLRERIRSYCLNNGQNIATQISVSTLHSLALRILRAAGLLTAYPADPIVMDNWELKNIFDKEFGSTRNIGSTRCEEIRRNHEAYWSTGEWGPPNYIPPTPPISEAERNHFHAFHELRTHTYSCVLPGEIVRQCVDHIRANTIDPVDILNLSHLIVDEYQDLNPMDLEFIDLMSERGAILFVAGDDDQSIYSFRHASPQGIQNFANKYPECSTHSLNYCFRCTPAVLNAGVSVIVANPGPNRIAKNFASLYCNSDPKVDGVKYLWKFPSGVAEARCIAECCSCLIKNGLNPRDILILISNSNILWSTLAKEFQRADVPVESPKTEGFLDLDVGRLALNLVRIACDDEDYIAHRSILGLIPGVGVGTCNSICESVIANNLNFINIFYNDLPAAIFSGRPLRALNRVRGLCAELLSWESDELLSSRFEMISSIINEFFGDAARSSWINYISSFPTDGTLSELRDYLLADNDEQQSALLKSIYERLSLTVPEKGFVPQRVRVMTMHGAKGLSSRVVFIPGLENEILPGPKRQPYPGLVLEAARLLYVSVTRARAACVISYATTRIINGALCRETPSRFCTQLDGAFSYLKECTTSDYIQHIMHANTNL
jgi:superfamily I DNA/RNA helicase